MALSKNCISCFAVFITIDFFLCSLALPPPKPEDMVSLDNDENLRGKMVLGSRPPASENKCMSCSPCEAIVVIPPHPKRKRGYYNNYYYKGDDRSYYLLSWRCRCGNKFYLP